MKVLVISSYSENVAGLNFVTSMNKSWYCNQHGYQFENIDSQYYEYMNVLHILRDRIKENDIVMNMGCDTAFTNIAIKIEDKAILDDPRPVISKEELGNNPVNNDTMIWKNTPECIDLIDRIIDEHDQWKNHGWYWQNHISINYLDKLKIMPARHMNSTFFPYDRNGNEVTQKKCPSSWEVGDWVMHALGFPINTRTEIIKWAIQKSCGTTFTNSVQWID